MGLFLPNATSCHNPLSGIFCFLSSFTVFTYLKEHIPLLPCLLSLPVVISVAEEVQEPYHSVAASGSFSSVQSGAYTK